jgi:hypothetical protein
VTDRIFHAIIGLPESGKTTFLAALWHLIEAGEVTTQLTLDHLEGDREYLNTIAECWRQCEKVPRTSGAGEVDVSILVHEPKTGRRAKLGFPDLAGEAFRQQVASRQCKKNYIDGFDDNGGVMLFLTADRPQDGITLLDMGAVLDEDEQLSSEQQEWDPKLLPQQVQLVELLQFLQRHPFRRIQRRLAVIVSAWDVIDDPSLLPEAWLGRELPLLHQFLQSNSASFEFRVYGISAQGGNLDEGKDSLLEKTPSERIKCVGDEVVYPHDITAPIHWLMAGS